MKMGKKKEEAKAGRKGAKVEEMKMKKKDAAKKCKK